jgi:predicted nucleic acid-binding protein
MEAPSDTYLKALDAAKRELVEITAVQERLEKRKIALRKAIEVFNGLTSDDESGFTTDAVYLIENKALPDEIRNVLKSLYPGWVTPNRIMTELKQIGRDLSKYSNPQSAIQTILKRMAESGDDPTEEQTQPDGKKAYRCPSTSHQLAEAYGVNVLGAMTLDNSLVEAIRKQYAVAAQLDNSLVEAIGKQYAEAAQLNNSLAEAIVKQYAEAAQSVQWAQEALKEQLQAVEVAHPMSVFAPPTDARALEKQIHDAVVTASRQKRK